LRSPSSSPSTTSPPARPVTLVVEFDPPSFPAVASVSGETDPPVDGPAAVVPAVDVVAAGPVAGPPVEDDCGAAAVCGAGLELSLFPVDVVTDEVPGVEGAEVLLVSVVTVAVPPGLAAGAGAVVVGGVLADWRTDSDGFELPLPLGATVVVGAGTVVAGAAVVGGVVVATVPEAPLAAVPWAPVEVPAGDAGAVSAEAAEAFRTRKSPARSAKEAAHLRGFTPSNLVPVLIGSNGPPWLNCGRGRPETSAGTSEV
jgi:hypothetical protein